MSRIGKIPVKIADGVKVNMSNLRIEVEGPKGKLAMTYKSQIDIAVQDNNIILTRKDDSKRSKAMHGLYRNLVNNMVIGVAKGFTRVLLINGVGYRAEKRGNILVLNLGYSNPIEYPIPEGVSIDVEANIKIIVGCSDKQRLGQVCAEIRGFRSPEPYKGKGIRYDNEVVRKKVGKTGVK
jgi:large subunit ribosomal protein L6